MRFYPSLSVGWCLCLTVWAGGGETEVEVSRTLGVVLLGVKGLGVSADGTDLFPVRAGPLCDSETTKRMSPVQRLSHLCDTYRTREVTVT